MKNFVYAVCGAKEYINELNFSLKFLKKFTNNEILVVTDSSRNELHIEHNNIIDIETPKEFSNHQAAIYLKTGLNKFVPDIKKNEFCYLDSDIIAISKNIDLVFDYSPNPVKFVKDHCPFKEFSPHAINCDCLEKTIATNTKFYDLINSNFPQNILKHETADLSDTKKLEDRFDEIKQKSLKSVLKASLYLLKRYLLPVKSFSFGEFVFNKKNRCWYNKQGEIINFDHNYYINLLKKNEGIQYFKDENRWINDKGEDITPKTPACNHLSEYILKNYGINIPGDWNHWNGGLFRFNANSDDFLNYWHKITLDEFNKELTKTRDQGTLAIAAWKFGVQDIKTLPVKFNFIAEYSDNKIKWDEIKGFTYNGFKSTFNPYFVHIYHNWGDKNWDIWLGVIKIAEKNHINLK